MPKATRDPGLLEFRGKIERGDQAHSSAFIQFPFDLKETFGLGTLVPVRATFDGIPYRGSITKMGGRPLLLIKKEIRSQLKKEDGDAVAVTVQLETAPREVEIPQDLLAQLQQHSLLEHFTGLAFTHRKEYVRWIEEAKRPETRARRLEKATEMLRQRQTLS